jgi:CDP-L-myo-inositol myo-inositolphosphotransferase
LIVRNILGLKACGINQFVVVTGCYADEIRSALGDGRKWGVLITYVHNERWQQGNGTSALALKQVLKPDEKFVLLMADHLFQPGALQAFLSQGDDVDGETVLLAADKKLSDVHDLDECTKIRTDGQKALMLGKGLAEYDAVDCGLFLSGPALLDALAQAAKEGRYQLTDAVNRLAHEGKVKLSFVRHRWVDVDDASSVKAGEQILLKSLVHDKDGFISRHINRKLSLPITRLLAPTQATPNQITVLSFLISILSAFCFALGLPWAGGLLAQFSSILDGVDGEIARLKWMQSAYGELFDSLLDRYADFFIVGGMAYGWCTQTENPAIALIVSLLALSGQPLSMMLKEKYKTLTGRTFIPEQDDGLFRYVPANRDGRLFLVMLGGLFNLIPVTLVVLAVVSHGQTITRLVLLRHKLN